MFSLQSNKMDLVSRSNTGYIENMSYKAAGWGGGGRLCRLKYMRFLLLFKMSFLRNWLKLYFNLMKLFD
jgi:hypothetical protein